MGVLPPMPKGWVDLRASSLIASLNYSGCARPPLARAPIEIKNTIQNFSPPISARRTGVTSLDPFLLKSLKELHDPFDGLDPYRQPGD